MIETPVPGLEAARAELAPTYAAYFPQWGNPYYVISLEIAGYCLALARHIGARRVADFGTGFTSVALGLYAAQSGAVAHSIDSQPEWATQTRNALQAHSLPADGVYTWSMWSESGEGDYDLAVYDYSVGQDREDKMAPATNALRPGGLIVFDDMGHGTHNLVAYQAVEARGGKMINLAPWTTDGYGRWALLGIMPERS